MPKSDTWPGGVAMESLTNMDSAGSCDSVVSMNSGFSDDSLEYLSPEERACLMFLEQTIESLEMELEIEEDSGLSNDEPDGGNLTGKPARLPSFKAQIRLDEDVSNFQHDDSGGNQKSFLSCGVPTPLLLANGCVKPLSRPPGDAAGPRTPEVSAEPKAPGFFTEPKAELPAPVSHSVSAMLPAPVPAPDAVPGPAPEPQTPDVVSDLKAPELTSDAKEPETTTHPKPPELPGDPNASGLPSDSPAFGLPSEPRASPTSADAMDLDADLTDVGEEPANASGEGKLDKDPSKVPAQTDLGLIPPPSDFRDEPEPDCVPTPLLAAPMPTTPVPTSPMPTMPAPTTPMPTTPVPTTPVPTTPVPTTPVPTTPVPTTPVPTTPVPTPLLTPPVPTPVPTTPVPTTPVPTTPVPTTPVPTTPVPTTPVPTTPVPTTPVPTAEAESAAPSIRGPLTYSELERLRKKASMKRAPPCSSGTQEPPSPSEAPPCSPSEAAEPRSPPAVAPKPKRLPSNIILKSHKASDGHPGPCVSSASDRALMDPQKVRMEALRKLGLLKSDDGDSGPAAGLSLSPSFRSRTAHSPSFKSRTSPPSPTPTPAPTPAPATPAPASIEAPGPGSATTRAPVPAPVPAPALAPAPAPIPSPAPVTTTVPDPVSAPSQVPAPAPFNTLGPVATPAAPPAAAPAPTISSSTATIPPPAQFTDHIAPLPSLPELSALTLEHSGTSPGGSTVGLASGEPRGCPGSGAHLSPGHLRKSLPRLASPGGGKDISQAGDSRPDPDAVKSPPAATAPQPSGDQKLPRSQGISVLICPRGENEEDRREALKKLGLLRN